MKRIKRLLAVLFCAALLTGISANAFAEEYTYTVRFFSGAHGTFDGREVLVYDNLHYGDRVTFDLGSVTLDDNTKYYVKGIRESGKDNDTIGNTSFTVTKDQDYVVAYGIISSAVAYTVVHLDLQGNNIAPTENYYGNVGDKPVVSYQYIGGFRPDYYNITGTLSDNEDDNVYEFVYYHTDGSDNPTNTDGNSSGSNGSGSNSSGGNSSGSSSSGGSSSGSNSSGGSSSGGTRTGRTGTGGSSGGSQGGTDGNTTPSDGTTTPEEQNTPETPEGTQPSETEQPGETTEPEDTQGENENLPQNGETQEIKDMDNPSGTDDNQGNEQTPDDNQQQEETSNRSIFTSPVMFGIIFSVLAVIVAAIILFILMRRRNDQ